VDEDEVSMGFFVEGVLGAEGAEAVGSPVKAGRDGE